MIAKFFIERPVLANVIAVLTIILGLVALARLPVAQYPNVVPPTVQVTARYPGASAATVVRDVALPIEQKVNGVEGMIYMSSMATSDGSYTLTVTFRIGTDADKAQILVQNRVSSALTQLPQAVQAQGVQTAKRSTSILEIVALNSPDGRYDSLFLSNYATINLLDEVSRIDGVGNVSVFGAGQYAMRLWLDPQKLQARKLVPADVINAVNLQSRSTGAGQLGIPPVPAGTEFQYTINVPSKLDDVTQFEDIIIKADTIGSGRITRLRDVARVELGAQQYSQTFKLNGQPSAGLAIFQLPRRMRSTRLATSSALVSGNWKMASPADGCPLSLKVWLYCWAPSSIVATSRRRVMRPLPDVSALTTMSSNWATSSSLLGTLIVYWNSCPTGTGGIPVADSGRRLCRLTALMTSAGTSLRACSFCGSSHSRMAYCPAPNTDTLPTPSTREISREDGSSHSSTGTGCRSDRPASQATISRIEVERFAVCTPWVCTLCGSAG